MHQKLAERLFDIILPAQNPADFSQEKHGHIQGVVPELLFVFAAGHNVL